jgi:hypothetical protein
MDALLEFVLEAHGGLDMPGPGVAGNLSDCQMIPSK